MTKILVRFSRRKTSWEEKENWLQELQKTEFKKRDGSPDLSPSVYLVDNPTSELAQLYAEHCATPPLDYPPKRTLAVDTSNCARPPRATPGSDYFKLARDAHREYQFDDIQSLMLFLKELLSRIKTTTPTEIVARDVTSYAEARVSAGDNEWVLVVTNAVKHATPKWLTELSSLIPSGT